MLDVLARRLGWHGWEEIAERCGLPKEPSRVLMLFHQLLTRGYLVQRESGRDFERYRLGVGTARQI